MNQWNICCIKGSLSVKFVHWASHEESTSPGEKRDGSHAVSSWQILALQDHTQMKHIYTPRNYCMKVLTHPSSFLLVVGGFSKIYICRIFQRFRVVSKFVNYLMNCLDLKILGDGNSSEYRRQPYVKETIMCLRKLM